MTRTAIWTSIAATLESEIAAELYTAGDKLPTEATLAARFGVNRHTVRRALGDLADRGLLRSRRGAGVFVEAPPTDYPIGRRVRFHQNIAASGRLPAKERLRIETRASSTLEAEALELAAGERVVVYEGLSMSGNAPLAHFISVFPLGRFPDIAETFATITSVTEALRQNGVADFTRRETRLTAEIASPTQALHLRLREGDALLKSVAINVDAHGVPVEHGTTWFAGERVTLTITPE
ncbi:phosphonate metabolism transcriptional regulator PhnF [Rhodobacterales bacterium 59_46_T64]|nr:phosphonate metabolism transcriptional regulator PhnF [Rhodobacterales bacterium 59_46_T64]